MSISYVLGKTMYIYCVDIQYFIFSYVCGARASQLWSTSLMTVRQLTYICGCCKMKHSEVRQKLCKSKEEAYGSKERGGHHTFL